MCGKGAEPLGKNERDRLGLVTSQAPPPLFRRTSGHRPLAARTRAFAIPQAQRCGGKDGPSHWPVRKGLSGHLLP